MADLNGTGAADALTGKNGADNLRGNGGRDVLSGNEGSDNMWGGGGSDSMSGGSGDDMMVGANGTKSRMDMTKLAIHEDTKGKITFDSESAGFKNTLGMYKIGADGQIYDAQIAFANASLKGSGGELVSGKSSYEFDLKAGERIGFFVVPNAYDQKGMDKLLTDPKGSWKIVDMKSGEAGNVNAGPTKLVYVDGNGKTVDIKSQYGVDMFHSTSTNLNRDGFEHVRGGGDALDGKVRVGFEDLWNGGDKDFDDSVFTLEIGVNNVAKLGTQVARESKWKDNDVMDGGDGNDKMYGVSGDDKMDGGTGNDKMSGGSGNDIMSGGDGNDLVMGNSGDDQLIADAGDDVLFGGSGFDTVDFSNAGNGVMVSLNAHKAVGMGDDWLNGIERVVGSAYADGLDGDKRANVLDGGAGDDVLRGRGGADVLTGGAGDDTFVWHAKDLGAADRVTDFAVGDVLDFTKLFKDVSGDHTGLVSVVDAKDGLHIAANINGRMVDVATLEGVHGMTADDLLASGALLV